MQALSDFVKASAYEDVQALLRSVVGKFINRFGGEFESLLSEAHLVFASEFERHEAAKSGFGTWMANKVYYRLLSYRREAARRHARMKFQPGVDPDTLARYENQRHWSDVYEVLTEDARVVADMVLSPGVDLKLALAGRKHDNAKASKAALREVLRDVGWNKDRINEAFADVAKALYG